MRIFIAAFVLMMAAGPAAAQFGVLGCDRKDADPSYCRDGKPRSVCNENGHLVWQDNRDAISQGEMHFLSMEGRVKTPPCGASAPAAAPAPAAAKPGG
jgi:hypothetical protein